MKHCVEIHFRNSKTHDCESVWLPITNHGLDMKNICLLIQGGFSVLLV